MICYRMLALLAATASSLAMAIEEPAFRVVTKNDAIEIREYAPFLVAETRIQGTFSDAGNQAFQPLFRYISGNNRRQEKIDMTAPVSQVSDGGAGETIAMTAPVSQVADDGPGGRYVVSFTMPAKYRIDNIPAPADTRVTIREIPARTMAVLSYSGTWGAERFADHEGKLREAIARAGWTARGKVEFARYNGPFTPWFMRRNEVLIEVVPSVAAAK